LCFHQELRAGHQRLRLLKQKDGWKVKFILVAFLMLGAEQNIQTAKMTGSATDPTGAAIAQATIELHWDPSGAHVGLKTNVGLRSEMKIMTDSDGKFSATVPPGFYDVFVSAPAFSPACRKVRLLQGKTSHVTFRLVPDKLVTAELGDPIH
jgi:hypothetical protein